MHVGQPRHGFDLELAIGNVIADLERLVSKVGAHLRPDAILFTGDLAYSGAEYLAADGSVESVLTNLLARWPWPDSLPKIAPVPGNHDLAWQSLDRDQGVLWSAFHDTNGIVRDQFFTPPQAGQEPYWLSRKVTEAFSSYTKWFEQTKLPKVTTERVGRLPGEYTTTFEKDGARVGVLALNSAYYDLPVLRKGRPQQLALYPEQFTALGFADWYQKHNVCLAMTHHPPGWIHALPRDRVRQQYFLPHQIALHLCGHLHELEAGRYGTDWGTRTLIYQGRSIFGVEPDVAGNVQPSLGYTIGQLQLAPGADHATLRMYPRQASLDGGEYVFKSDGNVGLDHHLPAEQVKVRPLPGAVPSPPSKKKPPSLEVLLDEVVDGIYRTLYEPSGQSVFLSGPPNYGKTRVVQKVKERLGNDTVCLELDLTKLSDPRRGNPEEVAAFLINGIASIFGKAPEAFHDLGSCVGACLRNKRSLLVIDAYQRITGSARQEIANQLRHCMEVYRPSFRLLLLSRRPLVVVAPTPLTADEPSSFQTMLREMRLQVIGADKIALWASTHERLRDRGAFVAWLHRHTGGHPWLLSTLLQGLFELEVGNWPTWTRESAPDVERVRGLHALEGPLGPAVRTLDQGLAAIASTLVAARNPSLGLCHPGGRVIEFVATRLGETR